MPFNNPKLVTLSFSCPDPSTDKEIIVVNKDGSLARLHYYSNNVSGTWTSKENDTPIMLAKDSKRFTNGDVKWMYKKDFDRFLEIFMRQQITSENVV
jgi:hypothetical protein